MVETCKQNKVFLMDNTMFVHSLRTDALRKLIQVEKKLGEVHRVSVKTSFFLNDESNIRLSKELEPDGCIGDIGWYCARVLLVVFPNELPVGVFSTIQYRNNDKENGVPTNCTATFWYDKEKKKLATLDCSFTLARQQYFEVGGSEGSVRVENYVNARDGGGTYSLYDKLMEESTIEVPKCEHEVILLRHFREQVEKKEQAEWEDFRLAALKNQWLLDALYKSSEANAPVELKWAV
eukprot:TRINITY_DN3528_c0_g1_i1.p1 TRINITY_DN3528_c0_g1~~TRINITY_DN3528_c0_g1_i1.p1  ORF type:complete len:236 (-),score=55.35 TRINITY_DN3528_c0_g1_i1:153-860(-)